MRRFARIPAALARAHVALGAPLGFAQVFPGWNVWEVWQADDQELGPADTILLFGLTNERRMRIFVEDWLRLNDTKAKVAQFEQGWPRWLDLKGDGIFVIPNAGGLKVLQTRADIPGLAGEQQRGKAGSKVTKWTVKFYNFADEPSAVAWPTDANYLLDAVYEPDANNPITNAPEPRSSIDKATEGVGDTLKTVAIVVGVVVAGVLLIQLVQAGRSRSNA